MNDGCRMPYLDLAINRVTPPSATRSPIAPSPEPPDPGAGRSRDGGRRMLNAGLSVRLAHGENGRRTGAGSRVPVGCRGDHIHPWRWVAIRTVRD